MSAETAPPDAPPAAPAEESPGRLVVTAWLSDAGRQRLLEAVECEATDDLGRAGDADLVAVSTRLPKGRSASIGSELREATGASIVAVAHAGGEGAAVRMLAAGGTGVIAEGNEEALRSFLEPDHHDERLVDTYEHSLERRSGATGPGRGLDPVTGLPGAAPARGAVMIRPSGGADVAAMVAAHREVWDGEGFPGGLAGEAIPVGARVVAAADAVDQWSLTEPARPDGYGPSAEALTRLEDGAGTRFDPGVVKAAKEAFAG